MTDTEIRIVGLEALDDVARLFRASMEDHGRRIARTLRPNYDWRAETRLRMERDFCRFLVAFVDGRAVGLQVIHWGGWRKKDLLHRIRARFVTVPTNPFRSSRAATLTDLYVEPDYRRRGIGRALVDRAVELLREGGAQRVVADVLAGNKESLGLYESNRFEKSLTRFSLRLDE